MSVSINPNPYARYAFSPYNTATLSNQQQGLAYPQKGPVFTGGDLFSYINNIPVPNLESCTWSISVEVVGNYVMGSRDATLYTTGKRVIVGTLVFSQYDRHALLEQVFNINNQTQSNLWKQGDDGTNAALDINAGAAITYGVSPVVGANGQVSYAPNAGAGINNLSAINALGMRGLSSQQFNSLIQTEVANSAALVGATKVLYADQIPPFDLTLIGATRNGDMAKASIFGIQVTQETAGFSSSDMSNAVGLSFVALAVSPWSPIVGAGSAAAGSNVYVPPSQ